MKFHIDTNKVLNMQSEKLKQEEIKNKSFVHKNTLSNQPLLESLIIKANEDKNNCLHFLSRHSWKSQIQYLICYILSKNIVHPF